MLSSAYYSSMFPAAESVSYSCLLLHSNDEKSETNMYSKVFTFSLIIQHFSSYGTINQYG